MNTPRALLLAFALTGANLPLLAQAQSAPRDQVPEPPRLEKLEEGEAPAVNIPARPSEGQIQETRENGRVTSVKVTTGGSTYYLKPNQPKGSAQPGDLQSVGSRPAEWQVMEFNTERQKKEANDAGRGQPAPPAPPAGAPSTSQPAPGGR